MSAAVSNVQAVQFTGDALVLLDQRLLPTQETYLSYNDAQGVAHGIHEMVVRGAPAIGIAAAYGVVLAAKQQLDTGATAFDLDNALTQLAESRPTAVNLFWALDKMRAVLAANADKAIAEQYQALRDCAEQIHQEDIQANHTMGELGAALIENGSAIYTHCNTGSLATGGHGTALGVIRSAHSQGKVTQVYAGETRPWLQGARLTAWELMRDEIPVKLSCEGAAGQLLRQGDVKWIIVGADRITANGDVANKIGTYNLAVLAKHHGVKFMVVAPSTTFDLNMAQGKDIPIEERPMHEVTTIQGKQIAPEGCEAINPSFDMTPNDLIDAIVCEQGVLTAPYDESIKALLGGQA